MDAGSAALSVKRHAFGCEMLTKIFALAVPKRSLVLVFLLLGGACASAPGSQTSEILALPVCEDGVVGVHAESLEDGEASETRRTLESLGWIDPSNETDIVGVDQAASLRNDRVVMKAMRDLYPTALRDRGIEGSVGVYVWIDAVGNLARIRISQESRYPAFDRAAVDIMSVTDFDPATTSRCRLPFWTEFVVTFEVPR